MRPKGKNKLKREYATAERLYRDLSQALCDLQGAQSILPTGILEPAIDTMFDRVDAAERVYRLALAACIERGIKTAYGHYVRERMLENEADSDDDDDEQGDM